MALQKNEMLTFKKPFFCVYKLTIITFENVYNVQKIQASSVWIFFFKDVENNFQNRRVFFYTGKIYSYLQWKFFHVIADFAIWKSLKSWNHHNLLKRFFWRNILSQLQLIVLVWPSSPPDTAHLFIFELFVPILPRIQLI